MGRRSKTGGVEPLGNRIQLTFVYDGRRVRPTLAQRPTKTNLEAAARRLAEIERAISAGTFNFADEFPDYRFLHRIQTSGRPRLVKEACADYIAALRARHELAFATIETYRKILAAVIEPELGGRSFATVTFAELERIVNAQVGTKKTYNNKVSAIRGAWAHGYKNLPGRDDPARGLECVRIPKKEQPQPDPFPLDEAEAVVASVRKDWGELQGNYDEFRFFGGGGLRPSEEIALEWSDLDFTRGELVVNKARVMGRPKDETKNYVDRVIEVTPRGMQILHRQRALYSEMKLAGKIALDPATGQPHNRIFFHESGIPFNNLQLPWKRWDWSIARSKRRTRTPYQARHSSISWMLMIGKNFLWVAEQHGHSAATMLKDYAKWIRGANTETIAAINAAFGFASSVPVETPRDVQVADVVAGNWRSGRDSNPPDG